MRLFGREPRIGSLRKDAMESKTGPFRAEKRRRSKEERPTLPQDGPHLEVMPNGGSGVGTLGLQTGREF